MAGKIFLRLVGTLTCMAVVAVAWDAEARGHRHHRRSCCEPACCVPVCDPCVTAPSCCEPVCTTACAPACCYRPACSYTVVRESVIVPSSCCTITSTAAPAATIAKSTVKPAAKAVASTR